MFYGPNVEGVTFFSTRVLPHIKNLYPDTEYWIAGAGLPEEARAHLGQIPGVKILGRVDDLESLYKIAWFTVIPIFSGAGTNIKVIESIFYGKPVIATPFANKGYPFCHEKEILIANTDDQFTEACQRLISDATLRSQITANGTKKARDNFSYQYFREAIHKALAQIKSMPK
jgi:glycosyltransferase involved in cell wall biosynthesis